jgi:hypothetical protein
MGLKSIRAFIRSHVPKKIYELLRRFEGSWKRIRSVKTRLYLIDKKLPASFNIQQIRSLELHGIDDKIINSVIQDYKNFTFKHYGPVLDSVRIVSLLETLLLANKLNGDIVECGVYQGSSAKIIRLFANPAKKLFLFDTFTGFTSTDRQLEMIKGSGKDPGKGHTNTSLKLAKERIFSDVQGKTCQFKEENVVFFVGIVQETLNNIKDFNFSLVHLDMDLYEPTRFALEFFIPRIVEDGLLLLHDYAVNKSGYSGVFQATLDVNMDTLLGPFPFGDQSTALFVKKSV